MLSAILVRLQGIQKESKRDHRGDLMNICVSAYPDLRPWQVRKACVGAGNSLSKEMTATDEAFHDMYYEYLSLLLDPSDGHDAARQDVDLVTVRRQGIYRDRLSMTHLPCLLVNIGMVRIVSPESTTL
jgi:hypothetical protein